MNELKPADRPGVWSFETDAMKGELPPAWSDALKEYYKKLATE